MSVKAELITWNEAVEAFDNEDFDTALSLFDTIADSAKIHFNIGIILTTVQEHESAIQAYVDALKSDQYFAIGYFQKGVSNFLIGEFEDAIEDFNDALLYLRGNLLIDYKQLGLDYKLYSCEVLYNRGLCYLYLDQEPEGIADIKAAQKEKQTDDHDVIDQAANEGIDGLSVFSLPPGLLYRPPEKKIKNSKQVDYLGSSKLIAAVEKTDMFTGFKGAHMRKISQASDVKLTPIQEASVNRARSQSESSKPTATSNAFANNQFARKNSVAVSRDGGASPPSMQRRGTDASILPKRNSSIGMLSMRGSTAGGYGNNARGGTSSRRPSQASITGSITGNVLKVKCHYNDKRVIVCDSNISFEELVTKIEQKFEASKRLQLKYKDEDGELVLMTDQDDMDLARGLVGGMGSMDRLEIWCY